MSGARALRPVLHALPLRAAGPPRTRGIRCDVRRAEREARASDWTEFCLGRKLVRVHPDASFGRPATLVSAVCLTVACSLFRPDRRELSGGADRRGAGGATMDASDTGAGTGGVAVDARESDSAGGENDAQEPEMDGGDGASALDASDANGGSDSGDGSGPQPIPTIGLVLWFRGDDDIDSAVTRWVDRSSFGNDATQTFADAMPQRRPSTNGGLPAIEFDGTDDQLLLERLEVDWSAGVTFFSVAALDTDPGRCGSVISLRGQDSDEHLELVWDQEAFGWSTTFGDVSARRENDGSAQLFGVLHAPPGFALLSVNGVVAHSTSIALPQARPLDYNRVGSRQNCFSHDGLIAEIILYARALESFEYALVESYLMTKWRILPD
jgi:hypothetical protein